MSEEGNELVLEEKAVEETPVEEEFVIADFPEGTEVIEDDKITDEQANKILEEMKSGKRFFEVPNAGRMFIRNPSVEENQEAGLIYAKTFNKALLAGIEPQDELEKKLVKKGIIEDENDPKSEAAKSRTELAKLEALINKYDASNKSKQVKKLAKELAEVRNKAFEFQMRKQSLLSNSAESRADDAKNGFLVSRCTYSVDNNERVWETYEDYLDEKDYMLVGRITYEFITFSYGLASNYMTNFPEVKFLEDN